MRSSWPDPYWTSTPVRFGLASTSVKIRRYPVLIHADGWRAQKEWTAGPLLEQAHGDLIKESNRLETVMNSQRLTEEQRGKALDQILTRVHYIEIAIGELERIVNRITH
ncbi:MAG: hypothetical protein IPK79_04155 [Vampirovibrionales bacterium]|nr:hypothetical protein [Vampirovibrionales bacterium]